MVPFQRVGYVRVSSFDAILEWQLEQVQVDKVFIDKGMKILSQCCEPARLLLARMGSTEGLLTIALPPDTDRSSNGSNGREARIGHLAGFRMEQPLEASSALQLQSLGFIRSELLKH